MGLAPTSYDNIFQKCAPAIRSNIGQCGTVTLCQNVQPETLADLETIYTKNGEYRILEHLLMSHFQIKACGAVQHGMRDFFMANMRVTRKGELTFDQNQRAITRVAPFILADQKIPINNVYWEFANGAIDGGGNWEGDMSSQTGIPADIRHWPTGVVVFLEGLTGGGSKIKSQYTLANAVLNSGGGSVHVTLTPQNAGSMFPTASLANPVKAVARRGVINIGKSESYCDDEPAYKNNKRVPFWIQHTRWTSCTSDLYNEWLELVLENNPLYREFDYIPETERNRQMGEMFEEKLFNAFWFQGAINEKQNLTEYNQLPEIDNFLSSTGLGVDGAKCVGRKANAIGVLEQLRECNRWYDAQGATLNLYSIEDAIYQMRRVRAGIGSSAQMKFDVFTDGIMAEQIEKAYIALNGIVFQGKDRYNIDITRGENAELGMQFVSFRLRGRNNGVVLNVITDWAFDDQLSEFVSQGLDNAGRMLMFLDMTGIYMKVIESNKVVNRSGQLKDLAAVDPSFACVEETYAKDTTLNGLTWTNVVECPAASLILENFSDTIPVTDPATQPHNSHPNYIPTGVITPYAV